jgi:hypothetical protein
MAAAVPSYVMQAKRETELELIFRGEEYMRAVQKYQRRFGVYPTSIEQLVSTNGLRFIRRPYKDPVTGKDFRLITINPDGSISGSKAYAQGASQQSLFGNTPQFGQGQSSGQGQNPQDNPRGFQQTGQPLQNQEGVFQRRDSRAAGSRAGLGNTGAISLGAQVGFGGPQAGAARFGTTGLGTTRFRTTRFGTTRRLSWSTAAFAGQHSEFCRRHSYGFCGHYRGGVREQQRIDHRL